MMDRKKILLRFMHAAIAMLISWAIPNIVLFFIHPEVGDKSSTTISYQVMVIGFSSVIGVVFFVWESMANISDEVKNVLFKIEEKNDSGLKNMSKSIADQLKTEKTIMKIAVDHDQVDKYFETIYNLHDIINNKVHKVSNRIPFVLNVLIDGTHKLEQFFLNNPGGVYHMEDATKLYSILATKASEVIIVEPDSPKDYDELYTLKYINFIETQCLNKQNSYIFLGVEENKHTEDWLKVSGFKLFHFDKNKLFRKSSRQHKLWLEYSHLIFLIDDEYISCSVLPLISSIAAEKQKSSDALIQNFNIAEHVYLAIRAFPSKSRHSDDDLVELLWQLLSLAAR